MTDLPDKDDPYACSFCMKERREIRFLIAGPTAFICNECVMLCVEIIEHESAEHKRKRDAERADIEDKLEWQKQLLLGAWRGYDP